MQVGDIVEGAIVLGVRRAQGRLYALLGSLEADWTDVTDAVPPPPAPEPAPQAPEAPAPAA